MRRRRFIQLMLAVVSGSSSRVFARPSADDDPKFAPFFESLRKKEGSGVNGLGCCSVSDCKPVASRSPALSPSGHWEAFITKALFGDTAPDDWVVIPDRMVDDKETTDPRPLQAIACWYGYSSFLSSAGLTCFRTPATQF